MSLVLLVARMRGSDRRRCSSSVTPTKPKQAEEAAGDHGQQLLGAGAQEGLVDEVRRQHADEVAEEQEQHADVEQVAAPAQLAGFEQLRGIALPGVLVAVEADQAAEQEDREADVGIDAEDEVVDVAHDHPPGAAPCAAFLTMWTGCGWPGLAWPSVEQPPKATGSSQLSSSGGSSATFTAWARSPAISSRAPSTLA